ncbi:MAG TPA: family 78 glycoside hydrolase catalytic domain [Chitinophagaceae bacterium]|nr:family 78 glycoside hydrolase catalytic domain [Chitinophagaceae bacterium]
MKKLILLSLVLLTGGSISFAQLKADHLLTENLVNPQNIDAVQPRFSWQLRTAQKEILQTAYEIKVNEGKRTVWSSGKVNSAGSVYVSYKGHPLQSGHKYNWQVRGWNNKNNASAFSEPAFFRIGLLSASLFSSAKWISPAYTEDTARRACPVFRKTFGAVASVQSAKLYITALGLYEATLNGKRIGDAYFTPGFTSYNNRLQYQVYDVTKMIGRSGNVIEVTVGEGWYRGVFRNAKSDHERNIYGSEAGLLAELVIVYKDGTENKIVSDGSWICAEGPVRYSELYDGEMFDAGFVVKNWTPVNIPEHSKTMLVPSDKEPVRKQETFKPIKIITTPKGEQVIDFGQNMAGWVNIKVRGKKGDTIRLSHAEVLDKEGNFFTANLRTAKATDIYILKGEGIEIFEPHFTYHGFRYVKLEGCKAAESECIAVALYSDLKKTGTFECSDPMINRLHKNIEWSLNSNFFEIPTDCPQRSERLGWTGDAQIIARTACYLRDARSFYNSWLKDLAFEQGKNGGVPTYIPTGMPKRDSVYGVAGWSDAAVMIPCLLFDVYGDTSVLEQQYAGMKAWVDYVQSMSPDDLWKARGYGDWYARGDSTSLHFLDQCFYAWSAQLLIGPALVLRKRQDVIKYADLSKRVREAFLRTYGAFDTKATSTQTAYLLALAFNLLPHHARQEIADKLANNIRANNYHLATGLIGTPYLLPVLTKYGYTDLAYRLLKQTGCPSWLYPVTKGATTIWEKWDAIQPDGTVQATSFNHYAYGAVGQWLYEAVAGIRSAAPGYKQIVIEPHIGGGLTWAKGSFTCKYGKIVSEWKLEADKVVMHVEIPAGTRATVYVPGKEKIIVKAGKYVFYGINK